MKFTILHFSDLHWSKEKSADQDIVIEALLEDIRSLPPVDLLVFSGDLVDSGNEPEDFTRAYDASIKKVAGALGLSEEKIVICPGNHDVAKKAVSDTKIMESGLVATLKNTAALNDTIADYLAKPLDASHPAFRLQNYFNFVRSKLHQSALEQNPFYDAWTMHLAEKSIGIVSFNTAWRSTGVGMAERHQLLLGERTVDLGAKAIEGAEFKIAVLHHPLDWLADWDTRTVEIPLFQKFDLVLCGHIHQDRPHFVQGFLGACLFGQSGCVFQNRDYYNGYSIVEIDFEAEAAIFNVRAYYSTGRRFGPAGHIPEGKLRLPLSSMSLDGRLSPIQLQDLRTAVSNRADIHVQSLFGTTDVHFDDVFGCPPISTHREQAPAMVKGGGVESNINIDELIDGGDIQILAGPRESGKTTVGLAVARACLRRSGDQLRIPVFVDFSKLKKYSRIDQLLSQGGQNLELDFGLRQVKGTYQFQFIVDNVSLAQHEVLVTIRSMIDENPGHHWLLMIDEAQFMGSAQITDDVLKADQTLYIHPLNRAQMRSMISRTTLALGKVDGIEDDVIRLIAENQLPRTNYIVSLLMMAVVNKKLGKLINEASLVENLIDVLLDKVQVGNILRSSTDFRGQNLILQQIALWLSESSEGTLTENDLLKRISEFLSERGINAGAGSVLERFLQVGLLEKSGDDIGFRFRAFGSFFLAQHAVRSTEMRKKFFDGYSTITYQKELAFLCDLVRDDQNLLRELEEVVQKFRPSASKDVQPEGFLTAPIDLAIDDEITDKRLQSLIQGPKSIQEIDERADFAESASRYAMSKFKEEHQPDLSPEAVESALNLITYMCAWETWGRALSQLDFVQLQTRVPALLRMLTEWASFLSGVVKGAPDYVERLRKDATSRGEELSSEKVQSFQYFLRTQFPLYMAKVAFSHIGSRSIDKLSLDVFDALRPEQPEKVGAAILLIFHRPPGWQERLESYGDELASLPSRIVVCRLLIEACLNEYHGHAMPVSERAALEALVADLAVVSGEPSRKRGLILSSIRAQREKVSLAIDADQEKAQ